MRLLVILSVLLLVQGCAQIRNEMYKTTGDVMVNFAAEHQVPFMMTKDDVRMNCAMSEALTPMVMSFSRVIPTPDQVGIMTMGSAGLCAEAQAREEELRYLRAIRSQDASNAEDALIVQKRFHKLAAQRNFVAYQHMLSAYGEPGGECPSLGTDFEELTYMLGLMAGLQALGNEIASGYSLDVPKNIAAKVERSTVCLSDDKWWGMPTAIRSLIWQMLPGAEPKGESAEKRMEYAVRKAEKAGVRLAHVMQAIGYLNKGNEEGLRDTLRLHVKSKERKDPNPEYRMMDEMATAMLMSISDRMWTEATGHRTPTGGLGTFWDDQREAPVDTIDLDDIL